MKKIIRKPYLFFLALIPLVVLAGIFNKDGAIDFNIYATYIVISIWHVSMFSAVFFFLIFVNYYSLFIMKKPVKRILTVLHIVLQVIALFPLLYVIFTSKIERNFVETIDMNVLLVLGFVVFLLASLIHFINFFISLLGKKQ